MKRPSRHDDGFYHINGIDPRRFNDEQMGTYCLQKEARHRQTRKASSKTRILCQKGQIRVCETNRAFEIRQTPFQDRA